MDAKELMIGDWIIDGFEKAQVTSITCDGVIETTLRTSDEMCTEPIELTREIFEKNDFDTTICYAFLELEDGKYLEYYFHEHRLRELWEGIDEYSGHYKVKDIIFQCQCRYVHELQHALKMCKINKGIEL